MTVLYATLLFGGFLLAVALIYIMFHRPRRARPSANQSLTPNRPDWERSRKRVLWDVTGRMTKPVLRDGVLYIERRSVLVRMFGSVLALVGTVAFGRSTGAGSDLPQGEVKRGIAEGFGGQSDAPGAHTDTPHYDTVPHSDSPHGHIPDGGHIDENYSHIDNRHIDYNS